jgi:hypothetical protein
MIESSMAEPAAMSDMRQGVPPAVAGPRAYHDFHTCDCTFAEGNAVMPRQVRI